VLFYFIGFIQFLACWLKEKKYIPTSVPVIPPKHSALGHIAEFGSRMCLKRTLIRSKKFEGGGKKIETKTTSIFVRIA
jgi:hypothetical protein